MRNMTDEEPKRKRMKTGDEKEEKKYVIDFFFQNFFVDERRVDVDVSRAGNLF